jgi:hypothetical protein
VYGSVTYKHAYFDAATLPFELPVGVVSNVLRHNETIYVDHTCKCDGGIRNMCANRTNLYLNTQRKLHVQSK